MAGEAADSAAAGTPRSEAWVALAYVLLSLVALSSLLIGDYPLDFAPIDRHRTQGSEGIHAAVERLVSYVRLDVPHPNWEPLYKPGHDLFGGHLFKPNGITICRKVAEARSRLLDPEPPVNRVLRGVDANEEQWDFALVVLAR